MSSVTKSIDTARIAEVGERIYRDRYQQEHEPQHSGQFLAIDVTNGRAFLSPNLVDAVQSGRAENPKGLFHLIRIGFPTVYEGGFQMIHVDTPRISG